MSVDAGRLVRNLLLDIIPAEWLVVVADVGVISGVAMVTIAVLVRVAEVLRNSALVARVSDCLVVAARVLGGLELLLDAAVLVAAVVVDVMGVLAVNALVTVAVSTVAVAMAVSAGSAV